MADYVLVHGGNVSAETWNQLTKRNDYPAGELLGGKIWDGAASFLRERHHHVYTPTLLDEKKYGLSDHIEQVVTLITHHNLSNVILVGASYGGMVITGVADRIPDKIGLLVYLDASFPSPQQSLFDILLAADYDPEIVLEGLPKAYVEKIIYDEKNIEPLSKIYVQCTESAFLSVSQMARQKISSQMHWQVIELPTSHILQATTPDELNALLLQFA